MQCGPGGYTGSWPWNSGWVSAGPNSVDMSWACSFPIGVGVLSWSGSSQWSAAQNCPVAYLLPVLTRTPVAPLSNFVPPSPLSNLWTGNIERTPMPYSLSSSTSILLVLQLGVPFSCPQSSTSDTSIPSTTASLPSLTTLRASAELLTRRKKPLPGPPYWASM